MLICPQMKWLEKCMSLLTGQQDAHSSKYYYGWLLPKGMCVYKYEICMPSNSKVMQVFLCCHGKRVSMATNHIMDCCYPQRTCVPNMKFIYHQTGKLQTCLCCHGNKLSIATNNLMNCYCSKRPVYQT